MPIETPCTKTCTLDPISGLCIGCARSGDEIARWLGMTDAERRRIVQELPSRRIKTAGAA